jgi:DnaJ-class molecular chaperone
VLAYYYLPQPGTYAERCEKCLGGGSKFHYPATGGIHAYPCPACAGRGEVRFYTES